jgi:hypothetical protein
MVPAIVGFAFFGLIGGMLSWRTVRMWRDPAYFKKVLAQSTALRVKADFAEGLARGTAALAAAMVCLALVVPLVVYADSGKAGVSQGPPALIYLTEALLLLFVLAMVAHLSIAWFNQPTFLVPPYLRDAPGVWAARRAARKNGK